MSDRFSGEQKAFYEELQSSGAQLCFNGINGATGEYGVPPMTGEELANVIKASLRLKPSANSRPRRSVLFRSSHRTIRRG